MDTAIRSVQKRASNREIAAEPAKVAFERGASEGVCGLLFPRGFKIIRDRGRSDERNHESQKSDFRMDEHRPISGSVVARVCSSNRRPASAVFYSTFGCRESG